MQIIHFIPLHINGGFLIIGLLATIMKNCAGAIGAWEASYPHGPWTCEDPVVEGLQVTWQNVA